MEELIDDGQSGGVKETPEIVKTLSILSIIGSSIWGGLMLIGMLYIIAAGSALGKVLPIADPAGLIIALVVVVLLMIGLNVIGIISALKMKNGKKSGFLPYAIATGIWAILLLLGSGNPDGGILNIISGLASIGFIIAFGMQMKNMPE